MRIALITAAALAGAGAAQADITNGFVETFAVDAAGWDAGGGLGSTRTRVDGSLNPDPSFAGANDGFLEVVTDAANEELAARALNEDPYVGSYIDAGVTSISFWLIDTGTLDDAIIRVGIGNQGNIWVSNRNWNAVGAWQRFGVDLVADQWTQVRGSGTFEDAITNATFLQFRADAVIGSPSPPQRPDAVIGSFGVDSIAFIPAPGAAGFAAVALAAAARRRR